MKPLGQEVQEVGVELQEVQGRVQGRQLSSAEDEAEEDTDYVAVADCD